MELFKITETDGILPSSIRLILFFIFLILIAIQTYLVLHIEQKIASNEGMYNKRIHPSDKK